MSVSPFLIRIRRTNSIIRSSDDFPKPNNPKDGSKAAYIRLQQWVKDYFVSPSLSTLMIY